MVNRTYRNVVNKNVPHGTHLSTGNNINGVTYKVAYTKTMKAMYRHNKCSTTYRRQLYVKKYALHLHDQFMNI